MHICFITHVSNYASPSLYFFLSLTLCINTVFSFCNHIFKPSRCLTRCLPLLVFPLIIPAVMMFSNRPLLMTCTKNLACLSLILTHNFLPVSALLSTSSLAIRSMYSNFAFFLETAFLLHWSHSQRHCWWSMTHLRMLVLVLRSILTISYGS